MRPYSPRRLKESIQSILAAYRNRGFPLARVTIKKKEIDEERHRIDLYIKIEEGPRVELAFQGNKSITGSELKKVTTISSEGSIDAATLEDSVSAIKARYRERGMPEAEVAYTKEKLDNGNIKITFRINEGRKTRIRKIEFLGNKNIKAKRLKSEMAIKPLSLIDRGVYDERTLANDIQRIKYLYQSNGFPDVNIEAPEVKKNECGDLLDIRIHVEEGEQLVVEDIVFKGDVHLKESKLKKSLKNKVGEPLDLNALEDDTEEVKRIYANNGYPYAEVNLHKREGSQKGKVVLEFEITSGPLVQFGEVSITGDFITSQKAIKNNIQIREGEPFSYEKILNSKQNLRKLGAFAGVEITPHGLENRETRIPVSIRVEEARPFRLDLNLGFSTDELIIGGIDFLNTNSFGWGKQTSFRIIGGKKFSRGEISWLDPALAGSEISMTSAAWLQYEEKKPINYIQVGGGIGFARSFHRTSFLVRNNITKTYPVASNPYSLDPASLRDNLIIDTLLSFAFDARDNFADPKRGIYLSAYTNFMNEIKGRGAHFIKFGSADGFYASLGRFTLANEVRIDNIQSLKSDTSIPSQELFVLGGDNSIRGFDRNSLGPVDALGRPTGGRHRLIVNNELRIGISPKIKWVVFHDMGFLTNDYKSIGLDDLRHSAGFGLHYITPIGPIKADYAFILDRQKGEEVGRFHLTFGQAF
jgi:outer membrane protein insertion porin family